MNNIITQQKENDGSSSIKITTFFLSKKQKNKDRKSHLIAAFRNDEQPYTRVFAAPRASWSFCMSSSSARSKCCGTGIRGNFL